MPQQIDFEELVFRGIESDELDYKSAQDWNSMSRQARGKIVRHLLAFANTRGGYIVIGVGEDGSGYPSLRTGLTPKQCASFDPSTVGSFVNQHVEPAIDFTIARPRVRGKRYAVFVVRPFRDIPHVCSRAIEGELHQGMFYIRTADASSRPASRAFELQDLIRRSLRNQREMLGRMLRGILYENRSEQLEDKTVVSADEDATAEVYFKRRCGMTEDTVIVSFGVSVKGGTAFRLSVPEMKKMISRTAAMLPQMQFYTPQLIQNCTRINVGLRCFSREDGKLWQMFDSGHMLAIRRFMPEKGKLDVTEIYRCLAENMVFASRIFPEFVFPDEMLEIKLEISCGKQVRIVSVDGKRQFPGLVGTSSMQISRSAADLASGIEEHVLRLWNMMCKENSADPADVKKAFAFLGKL